MTIKTDLYGLFVRKNGKWSKSPYHGLLLTKDDIMYSSGVGNDYNYDKTPFKYHKAGYEKQSRKQYHHPVKLCRQCWKD